MDAPNDAKDVFKKCGSCSQTFGFLLDREFGHPMDAREEALTPLAGGIMNRGHQCGMLWGAALGVGAEAARRHDDPDHATAAAIAATQQVVASFVDRTSTVDCREITGRKLDSVLGLAKFMIDTMIQGMDESPCFVLAERWAPEAIASAKHGLAEEIEVNLPTRSCASEVVHKLGGSPDEATMVAGFAGGLGLSGNACGALGAAIWMKNLAWRRANPDKTMRFFRNTDGKQTLEVFEEATGGEFSCRKICGRSFQTIDEHSAYIAGGGCLELIDVLAK